MVFEVAADRAITGRFVSRSRATRNELDEEALYQVRVVTTIQSLEQLPKARHRAKDPRIAISVELKGESVLKLQI
ncbi:MAG TPA: hypothetical protein VKT78_01855 [Fimbriimonadaceae bacterium]|nr:hypothetical protein [Fimbriimonadaceae bacterium]